MSFEETGLDPRLLRALAKRGLTAPTPVQSAAIPKVDTVAARRAPSAQACRVVASSLMFALHQVEM